MRLTRLVKKVYKRDLHVDKTSFLFVVGNSGVFSEQTRAFHHENTVLSTVVSPINILCFPEVNDAKYVQ